MTHVNRFGASSIQAIREALLDDNVFLEALSTALGGGLPTLTVTMTDAQIKASPSAPFELFAPLGANQAYVIFGGYAISNIVAPYTNQANLQEIVIGWDDDDADATYPLHSAAGMESTLLTESRITVFAPAVRPGDEGWPIASMAVPIATVMNKNLALYVDNLGNGDFTGGNAANTLKFVIYYAIATP